MSSLGTTHVYGVLIQVFYIKFARFVVSTLGVVFLFLSFLRVN